VRKPCGPQLRALFRVSLRLDAKLIKNVTDRAMAIASRAGSDGAEDLRAAKHIVALVGPRQSWIETDHTVGLWFALPARKMGARKRFALLAIRANRKAEPCFETVAIARRMRTSKCCRIRPAPGTSSPKSFYVIKIAFNASVAHSGLCFVALGLHPKGLHGRLGSRPIGLDHGTIS
jgi:hypothetical protein